METTSLCERYGAPQRHPRRLVADEGLGLFAGLNAFPKKSFLSEYSSRIDHAKTLRLLAGWHAQTSDETLFPGESFNPDFHAVPYYGADPLVERHYVSMRSRRQPSVLAFLAQDAGSHAFCYANADLRKGEEAEEVFAFVNSWKRTHGGQPRHLVFDSKLNGRGGHELERSRALDREGYRKARPTLPTIREDPRLAGLIGHASV